MNRRGIGNIALALIAVIGGFACGYFLFMTPNAPTVPVEPAPEPPQQPAAAAAPVPAPKLNSEWNTYHGPATFTGAVDAPLPDRIDLLWRFKAGAAVRQTPVVYNGLIYFATARGEIIAVNPEGQRVWSRQMFSGEQGKDGQVRAEIEAPPACFDGLVVVGTMGGVVHALDAASGVEQWRAQVDSPVIGSPNYLKTAAGARIYVIGRADAVLYCLDAGTGAIVWRGEPIDRCDGSPAVSERAVAFGSCAAALHVFSPDTGALARNIELDADSQVAAGVALDGDWIVSGSRSGKVVQVSAATGQAAWTNTEIEAEVFTTPAITAGRVVVAGNDGYVYAIDRSSGKVVWRYDAGGSPSSPVIAGDKVLAAANGLVFMLRLDDGGKIWEFKVGDEITGPSIALGRVFAGSEDGTVVAFGSESSVSPNSAEGGAETR
ncbi:MAG: PQQ-binding-like beta-propeller repeat protein [Candidatus Hydrogenedentes bacterium]|nr:PQQ-binding-like beta-propeller repeat protein [Candidatus Hydrogenedentota bacterium]